MFPMVESADWLLASTHWIIHATSSIFDSDSFWGQPSAFGLPLGVVAVIFMVLKSLSDGNKTESARPDTSDREVLKLKREISSLKASMTAGTESQPGNVQGYSKTKMECPAGHGPLKLWNGKPRCWKCGFTSDSTGISSFQTAAPKAVMQKIAWPAFAGMIQGHAGPEDLEQWLTEQQMPDMFYFSINKQVQSDAGSISHILKIKEDHPAATIYVCHQSELNITEPTWVVLGERW